MTKRELKRIKVFVKNLEGKELKVCGIYLFSQAEKFLDLSNHYKDKNGIIYITVHSIVLDEETDRFIITERHYEYIDAKKGTRRLVQRLKKHSIPYNYIQRIWIYGFNY